MQKKFYRWSLVLGNFRGRWLRIPAQNSEVSNGGSNMLEQNEKKLFDLNETRYWVIFKIFDYRNMESKIKIPNNVSKITTIPSKFVFQSKTLKISWPQKLPGSKFYTNQASFCNWYMILVSKFWIFKCRARIRN